MEKFFSQRNKKISNLNLLADSLGHSLRKNVSLFSVNDMDSKVTLVTEDGDVIEGSYYFNDNIILDDIVVDSGDVFKEEEKFDSAAKNQISLFIESVYSEELVNAGEAFDTLVDFWGKRIKFNQTVQKLEEQTESFNNTFNITGTKEFERFIEVSENISTFLSENVERISSIPEIVNAVKLSNTVAKAFDIPRQTVAELQESGNFEVSLGESQTVYEMVCRQELVKKEILESKKSFESMWVTEPSISNLANQIFEEDTEVVSRALAEAVAEIPYLSLISKKQLSNTISKNLNALHEEVTFSKQDLKGFVGSLFEMKKPLRALVSNLLQEKYGVNVNNLKETPTFKTLLNTQSLIFESLAKVSPKGSVIKEALSSFSDLLKSKNGVEAIDINEAIKYLFTQSGYSDLYEEEEIVSSFQLQESLTTDSEMVDLLMDKLMLEKKKKADKDEAEAEAPEDSEDPEEAEEDDDEEESDDKSKKKKGKSEKKKGTKGEECDKEEKEDDDALEENEEEKTMSTKDLMKNLKDLEDLIGGPEEFDQE